MTGFDVTILVAVGFFAAAGFLRGFVQEAITLASWAAVIIAIRLLHDPLSAALAPHIGTTSGAAVLAFVILVAVPYFGMRIIARQLGAASRGSVLGPIDRVLGFGFGAVKGTLLVVLAFSLLVLAYDTIWGVGGRPTWITKSRTYPFINASSEALVKMIAQRRHAAQAAADDDIPAASADSAAPEPTPSAKPHHRAHPKAN